VLLVVLPTRRGGDEWQPGLRDDQEHAGHEIRADITNGSPSWTSAERSH
jgi:hypothetical protein